MTTPPISSKCFTEPQEPQPHLWDGTPMAAMQYSISKDGPMTDAIEAWNRRAANAPIAYTPGEWFDATTVDLMQAFFESRLPAIREAAKEHGYAIGLHGSMRRDLDLIAAPWREGAADPDTLAHAIAMAACGITRSGDYEWEQKPAGRVATCLPICWTHRHGVLSDGHIDLSVMPTQVSQHTPAAALAIEALEAAKNGLAWYRDANPQHVNGSDDEADELIERAITALSAAGEPT